MKLDLESGVTIGAPTEADLSRIGFENFAILSRDADSYIQCAKKDEAPWEYELEYQDGSLRDHFQATDSSIPLERVSVAFKKYLNNDESWRGDFQWKQMDLRSDASTAQPELPSELPNSNALLELFDEDGQYESILGSSVPMASELSWSQTIGVQSPDSNAVTQGEMSNVPSVGGHSLSMSEHDPFNEPETAHARARALMPEKFFWDCANELAPFGSDEGWDAYYEWRRWRAGNPVAPLSECMGWIMDGRLHDYNDSLCANEQIKADLADPDNAFLAQHFDMFTMDATVIATALGQLLDEGQIDSDAKQYAHVAVNRQLHPDVCVDPEHREILLATRRVIDAA